MKILKTYSSEHIISNRELKVIVENSNSDNLLLLDSGEYIRPKAIIAITEPEKVAYWNGYILDKGGRSFMRDGNRIFLETKDYEEIEYKEHPRYIILRQSQDNKLLKEKNE